MSGSLDKLLSIASSSISECQPTLSKHLHDLAGSLASDFAAMLRRRNGFYAFEGALHVFPSNSNQQEVNLEEWNGDALWRNAYKDMTNGCLFFAEDIFGGQFCIKDNNIQTFDPETGALELLADDTEGWAYEILNDYEALTGYPLAHGWQKQNGLIPKGKRLLPKIPFVAGGQFELDNFYLSDAVEAMKFRAELANQIRDLPDGAEIRFDVVE